MAHSFVEVRLPAGMILHVGRGLAPRRLETPAQVKRCEWCGIVAPAGRRRRCYGLPVKAGATLPIPQPAETVPA